MAVCKCGNEYSDARQLLGLTECPACGDEQAKEEIRQKETRVGPIYNKGPDQYLGSVEQTKHILKTAGSRKNLPLLDDGSEPKLKSKRQVVQPKKQWEFDHWEFPVDKLGIRYKRAVLKQKGS